jgi:tryptophan-rich sensory protein
MNVGGIGRDEIGLAVSLGIVFAAATIGGLFTSASVSTWYQTLAKPGFTPPDWIFGVVWTALYAMMGLAAWLVWRQSGRGRRLPLVLFFVQLGLNVAWSGIFFGLRLPGSAFAEIVLLWLAIAATLGAFLRISPAAGLLMIPYLLWVTFAAVLNFGIWRLNA